MTCHAHVIIGVGSNRRVLNSAIDAPSFLSCCLSPNYKAFLLPPHTPVMADRDLTRLAKDQLALPANAPVSLGCRLSGASRVSDVVLI